jgi:hypothetical protein
VNQLQASTDSLFSRRDATVILVGRRQPGLNDVTIQFRDPNFFV